MAFNRRNSSLSLILPHLYAEIETNDTPINTDCDRREEGNGHYEDDGLAVDAMGSTPTEQNPGHTGQVHVLVLYHPNMDLERPARDEEDNNSVGYILHVQLQRARAPHLIRENPWTNRLENERGPILPWERPSIHRERRHMHTERESSAVERHDCALCLSPISGIPHKLQCGHWYDMDCLKEMFSKNVDDERLFPPRCCNSTIPLSLVERYLSQELKDLYENKQKEYSTAARLYCSNPDCRRFIGPRRNSVESIRCEACHKSTCARCTGPAHELSRRCKLDKNMRAALLLGQREGWQRCPGCRTLIMRNGGCLHISCRCGAQFCYNCTRVWYTCKCNEWRNRIIQHLTQRFGRGNYLLRDETAVQREWALTRLCKRSWKSVTRVTGESV